MLSEYPDTHPPEVLSFYLKREGESEVILRAMECLFAMIAAQVVNSGRIMSGLTIDVRQDDRSLAIRKIDYLPARSKQKTSLQANI